LPARSSPGTQRARRAFEVRAGAQHLKCEHVAAARVAREAPERAALAVNAQARMSVFMEDAIT